MVMELQEEGDIIPILVILDTEEDHPLHEEDPLPPEDDLLHLVVAHLRPEADVLHHLVVAHLHPVEDAHLLQEEEIDLKTDLQGEVQ